MTPQRSTARPLVINVIEATSGGWLISLTDLERLHEAAFDGRRAFFAVPGGAYVERDVGVGLCRRHPWSVAVEVTLRPGHVILDALPTDTEPATGGEAVGA